MGKPYASALDLAHLATPATPGSGWARMYFKSDGKLYAKDSAGVETLLGPSAGGGGGDHADSDHADAFSALAHNHDANYAIVSHVHSPGAWQTMTGLNSPWANGSTGPRYRFEDGGWTVRLAGAVTRPSGSVALIYTLPLAYRPDRGHNYAVTATSAFGRLTVTTGGLIQLNAGTATGDVFMDGITFAIA